MNPTPLTIHLPQKPVERMVMVMYIIILYQFMESSRFAIMECEELLEAIARATFHNGDQLLADDPILIQRKDAIKNYLKDYPPLFEVQAIPHPPGTDLLSFPLRIVVLHEFMHVIMFRFAVFPPGTPPRITSPSRADFDAARGHGESGYWAEGWVSGAGSATLEGS
ncbi:hypothetical protein AZE42_09501 [Rhizopogon vesiculosus]|uniref:Uncharacterized protein n=1 Tax=Rhizopogon vesiculosus TaxID=180088 RepID=A0A1J8PWE3_9AGAM|nr:hypothetical protein AZE42_09501 [Rhizopogon vesiculosus]